jgi:hypothetical protein
MIRLVLCFLSTVLLINAIPIQQQIESRDNYDAIINLLPLYGFTKLEKLITKKTLDSIKVTIKIIMRWLFLINYY